ncbi:MAG: DUF5309 family protein [Muribaculaceae bacterium]|nr:DUF5309 family protein [Muribaculaceae bacterium]
MQGEIINGKEGGKHVVAGPLTTSLTKEASPSLLLSEIDSRVVKVRPSSTPIDQISRLAGSRRAGSMVVDYYSVDTKPDSATVQDEIIDYGVPSSPIPMSTSNDAIFDASETILVPGVTTQAGETLVFYVTERVPGDCIKVLPVNLAAGEELPAIEEGTKIVRMGRAAAELDVQTSQFEALPVKSTNFCQIFKAQVEQSTLQKLTNKEVGWTFNDQEEVAVIDMRLGIEKNFLFGHKCRVLDPNKGEDIMLTGGIWNQTDHEFSYDPSAPADAEFIVNLTRSAFTGSNGSRRKILVAGSGLIDLLNKIEHTKTVGATQTVTKWGIDFTELRSKFGVLYVIHSEVFDLCGFPKNGMVIDPQYLTKYSFIPMNAERLDLKRSGQRNTDAVIITEASCLVLRYPRTHMRVVAQG